ncbi:MAG: MgtC/SapB family protein, partial [Candidatus Eremiobacteraeota bacterium]|nr:MgtC/SapB family protein [Candidatus Eremiobacteraeota bacterium]
MHFLPSDQWPYLAALSRLLLALAVGTFVGLEREQRGHMAGLRTFGLTCVLGC